MAEQTWEITQKGFDIAVDIYDRFMNTLDPIEEIAASHGLSVAEARVLMMIVEQGGRIRTQFEEEDVD